MNRPYKNTDNGPKPVPEVGMKYHFFDDGKCSNTNQEVITINGIKGTKFTSTKEGHVGNYIFIPFVGFGCYGSLIHTGVRSYCWSSSVNNNDYSYCLSSSVDGGGYAWCLGCNSDGNRSMNFNGRCYGYSVHGVSE